MSLYTHTSIFSYSGWLDHSSGWRQSDFCLELCEDSVYRYEYMESSPTSQSKANRWGRELSFIVIHAHTVLRSLISNNTNNKKKWNEPVGVPYVQGFNRYHNTYTMKINGIQFVLLKAITKTNTRVFTETLSPFFVIDMHLTVSICIDLDLLHFH